MDVFVKPNEQRRACSYIVMARIGNRQHGALGEVERQNALFKERQKNLNQELGIGQYEIYIQPFVDYFKILLSAKHSVLHPNSLTHYSLDDFILVTSPLFVFCYPWR